MIEVLNDEVISEMQVDAHCYRAERISPYAGTVGEYDLNQPIGVQKGELLMDRAVLPGADLNTIKMTIGHDEYISYSGGTDMDTATYIDGNNHIMVPIAYAADALGAVIVWDAANETVRLTTNETTVEIAIGSNQMVVNGEVKTMDTKAVIKDGCTMLPMSAAAIALDASASYADGVVTITK